MNLDDLMGKENLNAFCQKYHIFRLSVFGSALTDNFHADSDLDLLVEFEPGHTPGLAFFTIQEELSELLGRQVDLHTPNSLSPYFRETVIKEARVQYAA